MAGLRGDINLVASSIQYIINVLMTIPALLFMDRWGRRPMFVIGAILMMTWMFANAGLMASYGKPAPPGGLGNIAEQSWEIGGAPAKAVIACTYLFVASYAPTWGPASWVYPPEIFPLRIRGKAVAVATSANWYVTHLTHHTPPKTRILTQLKDLQLRPLLLRPTGFRQHPMARLHHLRRLLPRHGYPHVLPLPRDGGQDARGRRGNVHDWHSGVEN